MLTLLIALTLAAMHSDACDPSLAAHVYHPARLMVLSACVEVHGTIVDASHGRRKDGVRREADGDTHGWLQLDPEYAALVNVGNRTHEDGNLVFEVVCQFPVSQVDATRACRGFHSAITLPPVGTHVAIVGVYVQEQNHAKWRELHPVSSITEIPR